MKAKVVWLTALLVFALPACVWSRREPVLEAQSVPQVTYELLDSDSVEVAAAKVLQGMIDDIGVIKDRYPELRDWDGQDVRRRAELRGMSGFGYAFRFTHIIKRDPRFGRYGCSLGVSIMRDEMPWNPRRQTRAYTREEVRLWEELNLRKKTTRMLSSIHGYVRAEVRVGRKHSDGFVDRIESIFVRHLDRLSDFDARRAAAPQNPTAPRAPSAPPAPR